MVGAWCHGADGQAIAQVALAVNGGTVELFYDDECDAEPVSYYRVAPKACIFLPLALRA